MAGGLRPSNQLPVGATLKFKVVLALLPDAASGADLESNAQAHLDWLGSGLDALHAAVNPAEGDEGPYPVFDPLEAA